MSEVKAHDYGALLREKVDAYVEDQSRGTSLVMRIDVLNQICQPVPAFEFQKQPYRYDRSRIERIDLRRQEIIHRVTLEAVLESVEDDILYLEATMSYVVNLVSQRYRLPVDLKVWMEHVRTNRKVQA